MRIHRLRLTHVKGVADRDITFPDQGVVVVEGANEAGKTTMIEALDLLFDEKDSSRKRGVLAMRPVGLDVESAVEAEITSGPYRFTYRKQWFRRPSTVLTVTAPRRETLTGSAAHDRARAILAETTDLDLWHALRLMQATPLGATDLSGSTALADALDEAAGQSADSAGAAGDSLLQAAEGAYREFFTATGRPTGEYRDCETRLTQARQARDEAQAAVQEVADDVTRHAEVLGETGRLEEQVATAEAALTELEEEWRAAERVVREHDRVVALADAARQTYDAAAERAQTRDDLVAEVATCHERAESARVELARLSSEVAPAEASLAAAARRLEEARATRVQARRSASRAESDVALLADLDDLASVAERLRRAGEAIRRRRDVRDARRPPFTGDLAAIDAAAQALAIADAEWRAGSASWRLTPEGGAVEARIDGVTETVLSPRDGVLAHPVDIVLPGVARLRLDPPAGAADRGAEVEKAEAALADLLQRAGVATPAEARAAAAACDEDDRDLAEADRAVAAVLGGQDVDDLREAGEQLHRHVLDLIDRRVEDFWDDGRASGLAEDTGDSAPTAVEAPSAVQEFRAADLSDIDGDRVAAVAAWVDSASGQGVTDPGVPSADRVRAAREAEDAAVAEVSRWEAEIAAVRSQVDRGRVAVARAEVAAEAAEASTRDVSDRLRTAREKRSDDDLAVAAREARAALTEAVAARDEVQAEVERLDPDSLRVRLEGARSAAASWRTRSGTARDERLTIEARLRHAGEQGRAERLTEAESAVARAERAHAAFERRATAARTLYETLLRHREEVARTYVEPFGRAVSRLGRVVHGADFDVEVGEALTIEARVIAGERIPYEVLSSGAKEQMSILTRLACASLVDPEQGAPVIIDDALGYSDPGRLRRMCAAFSLAGGRTQIILLTCTPGRYAAIPDAHVIQV